MSVEPAHDTDCLKLSLPMNFLAFLVNAMFPVYRGTCPVSVPWPLGSDKTLDGTKIDTWDDFVKTFIKPNSKFLPRGVAYALPEAVQNDYVKPAEVVLQLHLHCLAFTGGSLSAKWLGSSSELDQGDEVLLLKRTMLVFNEELYSPLRIVEQVLSVSLKIFLTAEAPYTVVALIDGELLSPNTATWTYGSTGGNSLNGTSDENLRHVMGLPSPTGRFGSR